MVIKIFIFCKACLCTMIFCKCIFFTSVTLILFSTFYILRLPSSSEILSTVSSISAAEFTLTVRSEYFA